MYINIDTSKYTLTYTGVDEKTKIRDKLILVKQKKESKKEELLHIEVYIYIYMY
jgi:hypothetical protein